MSNVWSDEKRQAFREFMYNERKGVAGLRVVCLRCECSVQFIAGVNSDVVNTCNTVCSDCSEVQ